RAGLRLCAGLGVGLSIVAGLLPLLLPWLGVDAATSREAHALMLGRLPGLIPFLWMMAMRSYLQALDVSRPIVTSMILANVVNVFANGLLIFGDDALVRVGLPPIGLPALGVLGAGIASSIATISQLAVIAWALRSMAP